jgi:hypothetical protein
MKTEKSISQSGCDYCDSIKAMTGDLNCPVHALRGEADPEYQTRIDAARATEAFRHPLPLEVGERPIAHAPLFGGDPQADLFGGAQ